MELCISIVSLLAVCDAQWFGLTAGDECALNKTAYLNATVSQVVPSLLAGSALKGTYNISTGVSHLVDQSGDYVEQRFWLQSNPPIQNASALPFEGCAVVLSSFNNTKLTGADPHNIGCSTALPSGCEQAIVELFKNHTILAPSSSSQLNRSCESLSFSARSVPIQCAGYEWDDVSATGKFRNPQASELVLTLPLALTNDENNVDLVLASSCHAEDAYNPFNGSWDKNLFAAYLMQKDVERSMDEWYQLMLDTSSIVVLSAWPKDPTGAWELDVRTACLTPGAGVMPGSKGLKSNGNQVSPSAVLAVVLLLSVAMLALI